jgi:serine/threonine-protein kinase
VTYQLLSGRLPYEAASLTELALKQQREAPAWLNELDPAIPQPLAQAVDRALALEPAQRFPSAEAMRRAIEEGARGIGGPDTAATRVVGATEASTRVVPGGASGDPGTAEATRVGTAARQPRAPRQPRPAAVPAAPAAEGRRGGRRARREAAVAAPAPAPVPARRRRGPIRRFFLSVFLLALVLAGGAAAVVLSDQARGVQLREVGGDTVDQVVQDLRGLIEDNTR